MRIGSRIKPLYALFNQIPVYNSSRYLAAFVHTVFKISYIQSDDSSGIKIKRENCSPIWPQPCRTSPDSEPYSPT